MGMLRNGRGQLEVAEGPTQEARRSVWLWVLELAFSICLVSLIDLVSAKLRPPYLMSGDGEGQ